MTPEQQLREASGGIAVKVRDDGAGGLIVEWPVGGLLRRFLRHPIRTWRWASGIPKGSRIGFLRHRVGRPAGQRRRARGAGPAAGASGTS